MSTVGMHSVSELFRKTHENIIKTQKNQRHTVLRFEFIKGFATSEYVSPSSIDKTLVSVVEIGELLRRSYIG